MDYKTNIIFCLFTLIVYVRLRIKQKEDKTQYSTDRQPL